MPLQIDINSDVGERPEAARDGSRERLLRRLSSANIACGVHAGDEETIQATVRLCAKYGIAVGAHPSYPDRENFGRREMDLPPEELEACVFDQVKFLGDAAASKGADLQHVKPHRALYNAAARNADIASAIARAVQRVGDNLTLVGLAGSRMLDLWRSQGFRVAAEAFADRRYEADGSLRSRAADASAKHGRRIADLSMTRGADKPAGVVALTGARIITMDSAARVIENGTIVIRDNRIEAIGPQGAVAVPSDAKRLDLQRHTVMPGIIDIHAHGPQGVNDIVPQQNWSALAHLALGVTTVHDPSNDSSEIFAAADYQRIGAVLAPRIFSTGNVVYGARSEGMASIETLEDARNHVGQEGQFDGLIGAEVVVIFVSGDELFHACLNRPCDEITGWFGLEP